MCHGVLQVRGGETTLFHPLSKSYSHSTLLPCNEPTSFVLVNVFYIVFPLALDVGRSILIL